MRTVLTIAGSDPSGGAGLEADQKTITAHKCYALTATTALTAQNTQGVRASHIIPTSFVRQQIDAVFDDVEVNAVKSGMLASAETIEMLAEVLKDHPAVPSVVDPVMASSSGHQLLPQEAVKTLRERLIPRTLLLTPNTHEARIILKDAGEEFENPKSLDDLRSMVIALQELGSQYVLLKGGHAPLAEGQDPTDAVFDVLYGDGEVTVFKRAFMKESHSTHGTGCSLASAIACHLASGLQMVEAVRRASRWVHVGISTGFALGKGNGPINHFHSLYCLPFSPGHFLEYVLDRSDVQAVWKRYVDHDFVNQLAANTLPLDAFKHYMVQDYLYLVQFARAHSLAAYKAGSMDATVTENSIVIHINHEMKLHLEYCESFGISKDNIESSKESLAYTRYLLDIGSSQDYFALQIALAPCLLGYGEIGARLFSDPATVKSGNPYLRWIENYVADDYKQALKAGKDLLENHAQDQSVARIEQLVKIFIRSVEMEVAFWNSCLSDRSQVG